MELRRGRLRIVLGVSAAFVLLAGAGVAIGVLLARRAAPTAHVPSSVAEQVLFPVYTIKPLPGTYRALPNSFKVQEKALLFTLMNDAGRTIDVSEQAHPASFDFNAFYQQQMDKPKNLQHVPFPSVLGTVQGTTQLLSVVTDKTWLLVSSHDASETDMRAIAQAIQRQ